MEERQNGTSNDGVDRSDLSGKGNAQDVFVHSICHVARGEMTNNATRSQNESLGGDSIGVVMVKDRTQARGNGFRKRQSEGVEVENDRDFKFIDEDANDECVED